MTTYSYSAYDGAGRRVRGRVASPNAAAVEVELRALGLWLLHARPVRSAGAGEGAVPAPRRVPRRELIEAFVEAALLLRAGVTLPQTLRRLSEDLRRRRSGAALALLSQRVTAGVALHRAMAEQPRVFPPQVAALIEAGEAGGKLPEAFENLASYYQWLDQLVADIRQALVYPLTVIVATAGLVIALFTFVVPRFVDLLAGLSLHVPLLTQMVMKVSKAMLAHWSMVLLAGVGAAAVIKAASRSAAFRRVRDAWLLRVPVFGPMLAMFALSRLAQNLGMLYRAGVPLLRGLQICRGLVGNAAVAAALDDVRQRVMEGAPLSAGMARHPVFPSSMVSMIAAGETSGRLDFSLQNVAQYYNQTIPRRIKLVFSVFDPLVMLTLIAIVGVVALALVLPMLELWQAH